MVIFLVRRLRETGRVFGGTLTHRNCSNWSDERLSLFVSRHRKLGACSCMAVHQAAGRGNSLRFADNGAILEVAVSA